MEKEEQRKKFKKIRQNIENKDEKSLAISNKVFLLKRFKESKSIGIYSSLPEEVSTKYIINYCLKNNKKIAFPKVEDDEIRFYYIENIDGLNNIGSFGILEPEGNKLAEDIELMIVPGICFDKQNNRIGFGKGYYDKYFQRNNNIFKIGICFKEQLTEALKTDDNDIKMDIIITD